MSDWEGWAAMVWVIWSLGSPILHKTIWRGCWHFYPSVTQNSYSRDPSRPPMAISTMQHHFVMSIMSNWVIKLQWFGCYGPLAHRFCIKLLEGAADIFTPLWPKTHTPEILADHLWPSQPCNIVHCIHHEWLGGLSCNGLVVIVHLVSCVFFFALERRDVRRLFWNANYWNFVRSLESFNSIRATQSHASTTNK